MKVCLTFSPHDEDVDPPVLGTAAGGPVRGGRFVGAAAEGAYLAG